MLRSSKSLFRSSGALLGLPELSLSYFGIVCVACVQHHRNHLWLLWSAYGVDMYAIHVCAVCLYPLCVDIILRATYMVHTLSSRTLLKQIVTA